MGVPVITLRGDRFLSRIGESIAHNAGLADWIAEDDDDYVAKAVMSYGRSEAPGRPAEDAAPAGAGLPAVRRPPLCPAPRGGAVGDVGATAGPLKSLRQVDSGEGKKGAKGKARKGERQKKRQRRKGRFWGTDGRMRGDRVRNPGTGCIWPHSSPRNLGRTQVLPSVSTAQTASKSAMIKVKLFLSRQWCTLVLFVRISPCFPFLRSRSSGCL